MKRTQSGFTLIELLVVIAIIGLLSTLAVVALNSARQRSRDAKRVSDIRQIQTALELGYSELNGYPATPTAPNNKLGTSGTNPNGSQVLCGVGAAPNTVPTFQGTTTGCGTIYMGLVPKNPTPIATGFPDYVYTQVGQGYTLTFGLEGTTGQLGSGANCANQNGIQAGSSC